VNAEPGDTATSNAVLLYVALLIFLVHLFEYVVITAMLGRAGRLDRGPDRADWWNRLWRAVQPLIRLHSSVS